jgi:hypothetical protein
VEPILRRIGRSDKYQALAAEVDSDELKMEYLKLAQM